MELNEKVGNLRISVSGPGREIYVGKEVIRALGEPKHVCVLKGKDKQSIAITPCPERMALSFEVPEDCLTNENRKLRIYSSSFVEELLAANNLVGERTHIINGRYAPAINAVVFPLKVF